MLDECCQITGYHRKYVLRRLNGPGLNAPARPRRRAATYSPAVIDALAAIWEAAGYPWSLRLKALLPLWLPWAPSACVSRPPWSVSSAPSVPGRSIAAWARASGSSPGGSMAAPSRARS